MEKQQLKERFTRTFDIEQNVSITRVLLPSLSGSEDLKPGTFRCYGRMISPPQSSIHPRVSNGRTRYTKVNTSKARRTPK